MFLLFIYFCTNHDYTGETELSEGCWNPKRKFEVTALSLEIKIWKGRVVHCFVF